MVVRKLSGELKEDSRKHNFQEEVLVGEQIFQGVGVGQKDSRRVGGHKDFEKY